MTQSDVQQTSQSSSESSGPAAEPTGLHHKWWTLIAVSVGVFMLLLDITIVNVALPDIQTELHSSFTDLQWVVDAYALTLAALLLTTGSLADRFGRRIAFAVGLALFTFASLLCGLASTPLFLILARGAQGIGGATMFATSLALVAQAFRGRERGTAFGVVGAVIGIAVSVGPIVGGALTTGLSWRWIFLVNVPIGVAAIFITLTQVQESRDPHARRLDWPGFVTFSAALGALVYGLIRSAEKGWGAGVVVGCLVAAALLLLAFLVIERRSREPMFDLELFRKPTFAGGSIAAFAVSASLFALLLYLVLYLQDILGVSALGTGVRLLVMSAGIFVVSALAGRASAHVPIRFLIGPGLLLVGVALLLMRGLTVGSDWTHLIPGLIVAGIGVGMINPPLAQTAVGVVDPSRSGMASGINSTFRQVGIATGIATLGSLFATQVRDTAGAALAHSSLGAAGAHAVARALSTGDVGSAIARVPVGARASVRAAAHEGFVAALNHVFLVGAIVAFAGGVLSLALIRQRDFVHVPAEEAAADAVVAG
jgi:EmrB/QacA subfamily drug resistance transporter